jgi:Glycosyl transferase family 2
VQGLYCELTILMPCLNEAETLKSCIDKANRFLEKSGIAGEILIADNGSGDGSQTIARESGAHVVEVLSKGYGAALIGGIEAARGEYVIMGDADDSYDFDDLGGFVDRLRNGCDLVMGNRFRGGIEPGAMPLLHKHLGNPILSFLGRLFFNVPIGDFHCGLRGFRTDAIRSLSLRTTGMEFASEMVVRSAIAGLKIAEVPTHLKTDGRSRRPHLKTWSDGWRHLKFLLMYCPRWLFLIPGCALAGLGALLAAALFFGPLSFSNVGLDLNTFIASCLLVVVGVQLLSFGALARYFAAISGFLPNSPRVVKMMRYAATDRLVLVSAVLILIGFALFGYAVSAWATVDFGPLASPRIPRMVVAGLTAIILGLQAFFTAFFFGILAIPTRPS